MSSFYFKSLTKLIGTNFTPSLTFDICTLKFDIKKIPWNDKISAVFVCRG